MLWTTEAPAGALQEVDCASDLSHLGDEESRIFKCQVPPIIG